MTERRPRGKHLRRVRPPLRRTRHPFHPGVPAPFQPLEQFFRMRAPSRTGHPAAGKPKLPGHGAQGIFNNSGIRRQHARIMDKSAPCTRIFFNPVEIGLPAPCRRFIIDLYEHPDSERWETGPSQPVPGTGAGSDCQSRGGRGNGGPAGTFPLGKIRKVVSGSDTPQPDLFISAGHATHIPLICARHHFKTRAVLCMKPTLPCTFFDLCLIPRHDLRPGTSYTDTGIFPHPWSASPHEA